MITGPQIFAARLSLNWSPTELAKRAKVSLTVVQRAESGPGEPVITVAQLNALTQTLRTAGASLLPVGPER